MYYVKEILVVVYVIHLLRYKSYVYVFSSQRIKMVSREREIFSLKQIVIS